MKFKNTLVRGDMREFEHVNCAVAQCTTTSSVVAFDTSQLITDDLLRLAAQLDAALGNVVELICERTHLSEREAMAIIATIHANGAERKQLNHGKLKAVRRC